jgi:hypothetical protein
MSFFYHSRCTSLRVKSPQGPLSHGKRSCSSQTSQRILPEPHFSSQRLPCAVFPKGSFPEGSPFRLRARKTFSALHPAANRMMKRTAYSRKKMFNILTPFKGLDNAQFPRAGPAALPAHGVAIGLCLVPEKNRHNGDKDSLSMRCLSAHHNSHPALSRRNGRRSW